MPGDASVRQAPEAMLAALTRLMTGEQPTVRGNEAPLSPTPGHATVDQLLTAFGQVRGDITRLEDNLRREIKGTFADLRAEVRDWQARTDARLEELEHWRDTEEIADAVREGRTAVVLLVFRWLTQHWQIVWAIVALVLGLTWQITGNAPVGVGPVTP